MILSLALFRGINLQGRDLAQELTAAPKTLCVFGTYAADFNAIEYCQRLRHYASKLQEAGVEKTILILNAKPSAAQTLLDAVELDVDVLCDPHGEAGRAFNVGRGWLPDSTELEIGPLKIPLNAYGKLFGMFWGLGGIGTLPAVIGGYLGNPFQAQPWIKDAMDQNNQQGRWPKASSEDFAALPVVGSWGRRPLELATLRLQNMLGISLAKWDDLKPDDLNVLTQLGGCLVCDDKGNSLYEWRDAGICAVCNFEDLLRAIKA